jgi:hypothetical protein
MHKRRLLGQGGKGQKGRVMGVDMIEYIVTVRPIIL